MAEKILLVDDEEGIRKVLSISLMDSGYQVFTAENGEEALQIFREARPPIVLTDIKMPRMDGIELLQKIKEESPDTEVIMITGHGDIELTIRSLQLDAADFITKPIHDEALEIALRRAHERIFMRAQLRQYTENLEQLVYEKTQKLIQAERMAAIGQTVASLAHAIKNITAGLSGGTFVLEKGMELDDRHYLNQGWEMVKRNVEKIKTLALNMLNYAKEREPDYQLCDPSKPVKEVYHLMAPHARKHNVDLKMELAEGLSPMWLDPEGIHTCLLNLVTNAIDACATLGSSRTKTGQVIIRCQKAKDWGVKYQVIDNGCGMEEEVRQRVFQNFFSTKGSKGTGLGLMITKKIIDEHKGTIELESEKGKGTRFIIGLPHRDQSPQAELLDKEEAQG